jgi:hypothetical protein
MDFGIAETGIARGSPPGTTTEVLRFGIPFAEIRVVSWSMIMETIKMAVWCPRLNMDPLLRLRWWTDPLLHLRRQIKHDENLPGEYKWIIQLRESSAT